MPTASRTRGRTPIPDWCCASRPSASSAAGVALLDDGGRGALGEAPEVVAEPRRDRAPGAALEPLDEAPHDPDPVLEREPRVALAPLRAGRELDVAAGDAQRGRRAPPDVARRLAGAIAWRSASRIAAPIGAARRSFSARSRIAASADQLAGRVEVEQLVGEGLAALEEREPVAEGVADLDALGVHRPLDVGRVDRRLAVLAAAQLVAADRAAVVLA